MKPQILINTLLFFLLVACQSSSNETPNSSNQNTKIATETQHNTKEIKTNPSVGTAQSSYKIDQTPNDYRNKNWRPEEGNYFFSQTWTWEFYNEMLPVDDPKHKGTFSIHVDPPTGTMLLAEHLDEMTDWIIIHPDGRYTTAFTDVHGKPQIVKQKMTDFEEHDFNLSHQLTDFKKYFSRKEGFKEFGQNKYGWITIEATPYTMTFEKTNDISNLHILEMPFPVRGLYLVSKTNEDLSFPINLNFGYLLPKTYLIVSEDYAYNGKKAGFHLKSVTPGEYFANTTTYTINH